MASALAITDDPPEMARRGAATAALAGEGPLLLADRAG
jgi:hypothetical protein